MSIPVFLNILYKRQGLELPQFKDSEAAFPTTANAVPGLKYSNTCLGKVANKVTALDIILCQHVEKKRLHIIVESLMVQEEFG